MSTKTIKFRDWEFEVDIELTKRTYNKVTISGADSCICLDCKNYVEVRDKVFPSKVQDLFDTLGIDYRKEVEVTSFEILPNGLHYIGGWFHFAGKLIKGKDYKIPTPSGGHIIDLTKIDETFEIGFSPGNSLTFFEDKQGLIQIEFATSIPWLLDEKYDS